ncbi:hypothetical protein BRE01_55190 [Brevibacillus reuszeri]|uniref:Uncharacterized protein n=1 Tax=Brevibacillus reuszeri TaxID=54915 RepID=A0A0K9YP12_9BACL|nr:hypothetical protein [Brevibacillus reuszeri]KNB70411.1 hypothetical protein ADS79_15835 [Brevibacillus reuszeri]MED1857943.1 hypothetical protein [Brevibacillus reuszeri]GED71817.1 hypothetical protein BRE01_55190 [Brevibacillus reuszeri]
MSRRIQNANAVLDKNHKEDYLEMFDRKYNLSSNDIIRFNFFKFIEILVRKAIFDQELFMKEIKEVVNSNNSTKLPIPISFLQTWYGDLSDEDFIEQSMQRARGYSRV